MSFSRPDSFKPKSSRNSFFSSSSSSAISCSIWAQITKTSLSFSAANPRTWFTYSLEAPSSARSSSLTLAAKITGFQVRRFKVLIKSLVSSSSQGKLLASLPSSRWAFNDFKSSTSLARALLLAAPRPFLAIRRSRISISEKISSRLMVSMSRSGSTLPSTWITLGSSKQRTTWTMASTSRILDRNWFPRPSPLEAPFTRPAISTNSMTAGVVFSE